MATIQDLTPRNIARKARSLFARQPASCMNLLGTAPESVSSMWQGTQIRPLPPSPLPKRHAMYAVGSDRLLHIYSGADSPIRRSIADRKLVHRDIPTAGIPRLHVVADDGEHVWILEDRLIGTAPTAAKPSTWFAAAASWLAEAAGPPGRVLSGTAFWHDHYEPSIEAAPARFQSMISRAWQAIGHMPSRLLHGDVQPKNLVLGSHGVGLVDWEGCWRHGLPGLDIVFLALMASDQPPDARVIEALLARNEPEGRPILGALEDAGLDEGLLDPALLVMLACWNLGEERRIARNAGAESQPRPWRDLLTRFATDAAMTARLTTLAFPTSPP